MEYVNVHRVEDIIRVKRHELRDSSEEKRDTILFMMGY
jgi:hypothetical protein